MKPDPELDLAYLPALSVADAPAIFDGWAARSAEVRRNHPPAELAYGTGVNETLDVFTPERPRATVLFIHGGYWRAFYKDHFSYLAPGLLAQRVRLTVISYDLCPDVTLTSIVGQARQAAMTVAGAFGEPLIVAGNSAGGHLTAMLHSTDWSELGRNPSIRAGIDFSGLHDLAPLTRTSLQPVLSLTDHEVATLSPMRRRPTTTAPLHLLVGGLESAAFHQQAADLAATWEGVARQPESVEGCDHFSVTDELPRVVERVLGEPGVW